jgi:hypothetical protein
MINVKGTMKMQNKPLWKQVAISVVLAMVASGIVIGAGSVNNVSNVSLSSATIYVPDDSITKEGYLYVKTGWEV